VSAATAAAPKEPPLVVPRRVVAEVVEPGLADGHRARVIQKLRQAVDVADGDGACLVRVEPEHGVDALVAIGEVERRPAAGDRGADGEDASDARLECAGHRRIRIVECVEVRVGVDHAAGAGASTRGKSGAAGSIPSTASATPGATRSSDRSSG
jgi:hypothetical protein